MNLAFGYGPLFGRISCVEEDALAKHKCSIGKDAVPIPWADEEQRSILKEPQVRPGEPYPLPKHSNHKTNSKPV